MARKLIQSPRYEYSCDMCGRGAEDWELTIRAVEDGDTPNMWTHVAFPARRAEDAVTMWRIDKEGHQHAMVERLFCWGCLEDLGKHVEGMRKG